jgi:hypothetical protein
VGRRRPVRPKEGKAPCQRESAAFIFVERLFELLESSVALVSEQIVARIVVLGSSILFFDSPDQFKQIAGLCHSSPASRRTM